MKVPNVYSLQSYSCVFKFHALPHSVIPQYGHNAVCKFWCLHNVESEDNGVTEQTDAHVLKERNGHKNSLMVEGVEISLHCFHCLDFLLVLANHSSFFETPVSVKPIMQCNFSVCHNPHTTLSFTRKIKYKMHWSDGIEHFNSEALNRYKQNEQFIFNINKQNFE
jgi:hypothetical protein